jgi:hypothetical protein
VDDAKKGLTRRGPLQKRSVLRRPAAQIGGIRFAIPPYALREMRLLLTEDKDFGGLFALAD